jgi:uncharacterized protein (TIGR04255 family)
MPRHRINKSSSSKGSHVRLPNAPIVEAVLQIRRESPASMERARLEDLLTELLPEYSRRENINQFAVSIELSVAEPSSAESTPKPTQHDYEWQGLKVTNAQGTYTAMFQREFFSLSRLRPYESWESFRTEANRVWKVYKDCTSPSSISRLGLRYINRIEPIPQDADSREYLKGVAAAPPGLKRIGFFHEEDFRSELDLAVKLRRAQPMVSSNSPGFILLDIDVMTADVPSRMTDPQIFDRFEVMQELRYKVFRSSVTRTAEELFR